MSRRHGSGKDALIAEDPYRLGSLGDLMELIVDGWRVERLHYADSCGSGPEHGRPAAFIQLRRPGGGRRGIYIPDDGRAFSHRALVALFRDRPHIWKLRSAERVLELAAEQQAADVREPEEWGEVVEPFPQGLVCSPDTLQDIVAVGRTESLDGSTVALTGLERYRQGARLRYLAHTADASCRPQLGGPPDVLVVDDHGRRYRTAPLDVRRDGNRAEGVVAVAPAIPRDVAVLTATFGSIGIGHDAIRGPWVFPIRLGEPAS